MPKCSEPARRQPKSWNRPEGMHGPAPYMNMLWICLSVEYIGRSQAQAMWGCYEMTPIFLYFLNSFLVMWLSCDHIVTHCSSDIYCSVTSIVLWPIVQGDSIVPGTPIVLVTLLFSFTISTDSLWPYSLRLDFCILWYRQAIRVLSPLSSLVPSLSRYSL